TPNGGEVIFDGTPQILSGDTTFYDLTKEVPDGASQTLVLTAGRTQTVTHALTLTGYDDTDLLLIESSVPGTLAYLSLLSGGAQEIRNVEVHDNQAWMVPLIARGDSDISDNTLDWALNATMTWTGAADTNWENPYNWDMGIVPFDGDGVTIGDNAVIPDVVLQPVLSDHVRPSALTIASGATLSTAGYGLYVDGTFQNDGVIYLQGTEAVVLTPDIDSGRFHYQGNAGGGTISVPTGGQPVSFYDLTFDADDAQPETFALGADLFIYGDLSVAGGALLDAGSVSLDVDGDLTISGDGRLTAPGTGETLTLGGDFTAAQPGSTFTANGGRLTLDGADQSILGQVMFYDLDKQVPDGQSQTLSFYPGLTVGVAHSLTLTGFDETDRLTVNSSGAVEGYLDLEVGALQTIRNVVVQDNHASGVTLVGRGVSEGVSNHDNWIFGSTTLTWTGAVDTDWEDPSNWDLGIVPVDGDGIAEGDRVIIPGGGNQPVLSDHVRPYQLTLESGATLSVGGYDLVVDDALYNDGTVYLEGTGGLVLTTPDLDSGTFVYQGDGAGGTIPWAAGGHPASFYDVRFDDVDGGVFDLGTDLFIYGSFFVDDGEVNASAVSLDVDGGVYLAGGTLTAPGAGETFVFEGDWSLSAPGVFDANAGTVTVGPGGVTTFGGSTTFFDLSLSVLTGKTIYFEGGETQTVEGTLTMAGGDGAGEDLELRSTVDGTPWTIAMPSAAGNATVWDVDVKDSIADIGGNVFDILAINSVDRKTGGVTTNIHWVFENRYLITPADGAIVGPTPVLIGRGPAGAAVSVIDPNDGNAVVATAVTDANGNFRVGFGEDAASLGTVTKTFFAPGPQALVPVFNGNNGERNDITVIPDADVTADQVPVILTPAGDTHIGGALPTITGTALAGSSVVVVAADDNGGLLLTLPPSDYAGSGTADGDGAFSIVLTTPLPRGTNRLSVIVNGVSSTVLNYFSDDIYGTVFDTATDQPVNDAQVSLYRADGALAQAGVDIVSGIQNPFVTGPDGLYHFLTIGGGDFRLVVEEAGYDYPTAFGDADLPGGRSVTTGSRGEIFTVGSDILHIDQPVDGGTALFRVQKTANKAEVKVGDVVTYTVTIENLSATNSQQGTRLHDRIPPGFKFMGGRAQLDGSPITDPTGDRALTFETGLFAPAQIRTLRYQLVVGSGVAPGEYENTAYMKRANGQVLSNRATETVRVVMDPLFDAGTVFGKVFYDLNRNGRQDDPEYSYEDRSEIVEGPVGNVRLVMEDGTIVTTDQNGQFHIPGLVPGRHLLRVDERTLPPHTFVTNDKVQVIDVTAGSLIKVNFGVDVENAGIVSEDVRFFQSHVSVEHVQGQASPRLNVDAFDPVIRMFEGMVLDPLEFRIFTNYAPFVSSWQLDILDENVKKTVRSFSGTRYNMHLPIIWDGKDTAGRQISPEKSYSYVLKINDDKGGWSETKEKPLSLVILSDEEKRERDRVRSAEELKTEAEAREKKYRSWLAAQAAVDLLSRQTMLVRGETLRIDPRVSDVRQVRILQGGELYLDIPVSAAQRSSARDVLEGTETVRAAPLEVILPDGEYELEVISGVRADGSVSPVVIVEDPLPVFAGRGSEQVAAYRRPVKVGEDYMMFVALGDGKVGYNINRGSIEMAEQGDGYKSGFYQEGKMAYYLKGKVKGKYLVTSSFDTERQKKNVLRAIKDEEYYPVYGDQSSINYDATNTQGPLYLLVEWDKSRAIWGNYAVDFKDTEFSRYTRSLYGGEIDYTSVGTNPYGDPKTRVLVFHAEVRQRSAHNEMLGTGGSLYYLKHQDVVPGSLKVRTEVRDAVTGLVRSSTDMTEGVDFDADAPQGRLLFWQPVAMSVDTGRLVANGVLSGDPVYVVADYEYYIQDKILEATRGARVTQTVGRNVVVGGTMVSETQADANYELLGQDVTVHLGKDATIRAEYAESSSEDTGSFVSTDGGITYTQLSTGDGTRGRAFGIWQDARIFDRLGVKSYYRWTDNDFSSASTTSQQGKEMAGLNMTFDLTPVTRLTASYDVQKLIHDGNLQTRMQVGADETRTTILKVVHEAHRLRLAGEFQRQEVSGKKDAYASATNEAQDTIALEAQYDLDGKTGVKAHYQVDASGQIDQGGQAGLALTRQVTDKVTATVGGSLGDQGASLDVGASANVTPRITLSAKESVGTEGTSTTVGAQAQIAETTAVKTSYTVSETSDGTQQGTAAVDLKTGVTVDDARINAGVVVAGDQTKGMTQGLALDVSRKTEDGRETTTAVKLDETLKDGKKTTYSFIDQGRLTDNAQMVVERALGYGLGVQDQSETYKIVRTRDGKNVETSVTRKFSETQAERSAANIFGLTGDIDDKWAATLQLEEGRVQNIDGTQTDRMALATGLGYLEKDEEGKEKLKSSTKLEVRSDSGDVDRTQVLLYQALEGKVSEETTLTGKLEYSKTWDRDTQETVAEYKEILLGAAYRPVAFDRLNLFGRYVYKEDNAPDGQENTTGVEETQMHVLVAEGAYELNEKWQIVERLAYRIMQEKVVGFDFAKTHTWLLINRANYRLSDDWKVGAEYRILTQEEAKDKKTGVLVEAVRSINDNIELGIGYNFTDFADDLTNLDYTAQGPYIRMTGKLYDRTPEERARAREKWIERRVQRYASAMVKEELHRTNSPLVLELNQMFRMAQVAYDLGKYPESRQIYRDILMATQMMFEEAAQFIRKHIAFEEALFNAYQRAQEYYQNGEFWMARKLWEKIVEEAERSMLE
ncbi:MAG: DUF11 domain-containing protein, partial [Elusimicrobia bacterium]|nr:DUF11 domain-containing protein [Elusimicrobiota bacterium]